MVILMGVRMDRYREKKRKKHRRIHGFFKLFIVIILFIGLGLSLVYVNTTIRDLNYVDNTVLFGVDFEDRVFTILGKSYFLEFDKILSIFKPD